MIASFFSVHRHTSLWAMIVLVNYAALFYLTLHSFQTRNHFRTLIWTILFTALLVSVIGLIKNFWGNPFPWWHYEYMRGNEGQLISTFSNRNHLASYMAMIAPLTIGFMLTGFQNDRLFLFSIFLSLFLFVLMMSFARSAWVAAFSAIGILAVILILSGHYNNKKIIGVSAGGLIVALLVLTLNTEIIHRFLTIGTDDLSGRLAVWNNVLAMIKDHPVTGTGPGTFTHAFTLYHPPAFDYRQTLAHNEYLQFVSETGLPIVPGILWLVSSLFIAGFRKIKDPSRLVRGMTIGAMSAVAATLIDALASFNFHLPAVAFTASVLAAIIVSAGPISRNTE